MNATRMLTRGVVTAAVAGVGALALGGVAQAAPPVPTDVSITQAASLNPANVGRPLTYILKAKNIGTGVPKSLVVTDALPATASFASHTASAGASCTVPAVGTSGTVRCQWDDPAVGAEFTVSIVVKPTAIGTLVNTATASPQGAQDPVATNDSATTSIRAIPYALASNGERCTWVGTAGNDVMKGAAGKDVICGLGGNDTIYGYGGDDVLDGFAGNDTIYAGGGNDKVYGRAGADRLFGQAGNDFLVGGLGKDILGGGLGIDRAFVLVGDTALSIEKRK